MFSMVKEAYRTPLEDIPGVMKVFRVFIRYAVLFTVAVIIIGALMAVLGTGKLEWGQSHSLLAPVFKVIWLAVFVAFFYGVALYSSGVIAWHRRILLGDKEAIGNSKLEKQDWSYFGYIILFAFLTLVAAMIVSAIAIVFIFGSQSTLALFVMAFLLPVPVVALQIYFLKRGFVRLPMLAIEGNGALVSMDTISRHTDKKEWSVALFSVLLPPIFAPYFLSFITSFLPSSAIIAILISLLNIAIVFYSWLVFASLLTIFYRDHVRADVLQVAGRDAQMEGQA